jgi:deoxyribodipyrimidine photolyase
VARRGRLTVRRRVWPPSIPSTGVYNMRYYTHRHAQTHTDTHRHTKTHTDTHRHTQTYTDTHRRARTHTQGALLRHSLLRNGLMDGYQSVTDFTDCWTSLTRRNHLVIPCHLLRDTSHNTIMIQSNPIQSNPIQSNPIQSNTTGCNYCEIPQPIPSFIATETDRFSSPI